MSGFSHCGDEALNYVSIFVKLYSRTEYLSG